MNYHPYKTAFIAIFGFAIITPVHATALNTGDTLTITAGVTVPISSSYSSITTVTSGSYFGLDNNLNGTIDGYEKTALSQGTTGLVIGVTTSPGASHSGAPVAGDTNAIDAPWLYLGNTGSDFLTIPVTGDTVNGLDLSGWSITYNGSLGNISPILDNSVTWGTGYTAGIANFTWDGIYGDSYTLDYHAFVPSQDPSTGGGVNYALHLTGIVEAVPVPASAWLFGSGLFGLLGIARRWRPETTLST